MPVPRNYFLAIALLPVLFLSFNIHDWKAEALRVIVQDEDERGQSYDFQFVDKNLNQKPLENRFEAIQNVSKVTDNLNSIAYLDIKNVKFFYDKTNGSLVAEIVSNKGSNYKFAEGTTYGMAININPFEDSSRPEITDADFIYKIIFINGSWYKSLGIQHSHGEVVSYPVQKLEQNNPLNARQGYVRMNFNTGKIGNPEEFQVQFFASATVKISSSLNYTIVDVIPWIEVPQPTISLSLDPEVSTLYPLDMKKVDIVINSNSKVSTDLINFPGNYSCNVDPYIGSKPCWIFDETSAIVSPAENSYSVHAKLITKNLMGSSVNILLPALDRPSQGWGATEKAKDISQTFHFRVGSPYSDFIESGLDFPNKYPYIIGLISATGTFIVGVLVDKKKFYSKVLSFFGNLK